MQHGRPERLPVISIHALHEESDPIDTHAQDLITISIHALHEESDYANAEQAERAFIISIHALHEESDTRLWMTDDGLMAISIHALHEESDTHSASSSFVSSRFQSTLSMRRATVQLDIFVRFLRRKPAA